MEEITHALEKREDIIIHAPTGLGKTAAALAPTLSYALEHKKTIFFLTSRHTQHEIALKTLQEIKQKHQVEFQAVDIIGKKWMCLQEGVLRLPSQEFTEFCRALREDGKCSFYEKLKKGEAITTEGKLVIAELCQRSPVRTQDIVQTCAKSEVCPYYTSMEIAKKAQVIIGDYYYMFHPNVRKLFLARAGKELEDAIIIVDEAHNLPNRIKDLASSRLSNIIIKRAIKEAQKYKHVNVEAWLEHIQHFFSTRAQHLRTNNKYEELITRQKFIEFVGQIDDYEVIIETCGNIGDGIREETQVSYIGAVANFLDMWKGTDEGFTRIMSIKKGAREDIIMLAYRCLDPSLVARKIIADAHSTILMSGTLQPTSMYKEILGIDTGKEEEYPSPFPKENRLNLIIPKTSTKYTTRGDEQYKQIGETLVQVIEKIPGNVAVFFPSYYLLEEVKRYVERETSKTVFTERAEMTTEEKQDFIDRFRGYKHSGAVLLGAISGNFGEGIDLPGDELKGVVIVGLPLQKPDLETEALINYYDEKFSRGWDYGYLFPAFNKTLQSAGRCIRSGTDRGVIIFLDERYAWPNYKRCFPKDWDVTISLMYEKLIEEFFQKI